MKEFKKRMKEFDLTDTQLGAKVGVSARMISVYYDPDKNVSPSHDVAVKILAELKAETWEELMQEVKSC